MNAHKPESINALLDGELHGLQRWLVRRHVSHCQACTLEYRRLQHVRMMLAGHAPMPVMSDSPEFFWSKIQREIEQRGSQTVEIPAPGFYLGDWLREHQLILATAAVFTVMVAAALWSNRHLGNTPAPIVAQVPPPRLTPTENPPTAVAQNTATTTPAAEVQEVATVIPNTTATVLASDNSGDVVIWVTGLPWTQDMDDLKTQYASMDIWG